MYVGCFILIGSFLEDTSSHCVQMNVLAIATVLNWWYHTHSVFTVCIEHQMQATRSHLNVRLALQNVPSLGIIQQRKVLYCVC